MSKEKEELKRALQKAQHAIDAAQQSASKSPNALIRFLRGVGMRATADLLAKWIRNHWDTVLEIIQEFFDN